MTSFGREAEVTEFAKKAQAGFLAHPEWQTFTDGDGGVVPGCLFAVRWGMMDRCILVFRLDEFFEPVNFQDCLTTREGPYQHSDIPHQKAGD